jgi:AAA domain, putative AbiEii toxin, Type IV TA system/AAA domain
MFGHQAKSTAPTKAVLLGSLLERVLLEGGHKMIESLTVDNFRCFEHVTVDNLKRVNVIVGQNASGKTALLESVFFGGGGHPELGLRLRGWRQLGDVEITPDRAVFESIWRNLFYTFDQDRAIEISLRGTLPNTRRLRVFYDNLRSSTIPLGQKLDEESTSLVPIVFEYSDAEGHQSEIKVAITEKGITFARPSFPMKVTMFPSGVKANPKEAADRFSTLSKARQGPQIVRTIRRVFPFIEELSVETTAGEPMVYATVEALPEKVPVSLISEGIYRLMTILVGIANTRHGAVLIDEIENGFYHETLAEIWKLLLEFAEEYKTQLFVSTHSLEALKHAGPTIKDHEEKFSLLRTERKTTSATVRYFSGHQFLKAIEQKVDVR